VEAARTGATGRATLADWLTPDHIAWSVRHARELLPTERIRSAPQPRELPEEFQDDLLLLEVESHEGPRALHDLLHDGERDALVVIKDGAVVLDWIAPGVRDDEQHLVFSITKAVTGTLACALATRGLLDLSARASDVVPELGPSALGSATVRQLMDMEASFAYVEDYAPGEDLRAYREACGWSPAPPDARSLREYLVHRTPDGEHGERFRYLSPTTEALAWVCSAAAGTTWAEAVEAMLWQPAGAELGAYVTLDREGTPRAAGGLCALPRDVARFGLLLAERSPVVAPELWDDILRGGSKHAWAHGDFADLFADGAYRAGWYAPGFDDDVVLGLGIHGQMLYVDVPRQVVVVLLSSFSDPDPDVGHLDNHTIARTLAHALA